MAPQKFASVRHKSRPATRLAPFRDDTVLVAFRYEQTKQAEPPIPLPPPRNPLRSTRRESFTVASPARPSLAPIIIPRPPIPPPQDQHPLFRSERQARRTQSAQPDQQWKRDSGAPTTSSLTLRGDCDIEFIYDKEKPFAEIPDTPSVYSGDEQSFTIAPQEPVRPSKASSLNPQTASRRSAPAPAPAPLKASIETRVPSTPTTQPSSPTRPDSLTQKLGKTFSIRVGTKRLRKKTLGEQDRVTSLDAPPATPTMRGSLKSAKSPMSSPPRSARSSDSTQGQEEDVLTARPYQPQPAANLNFVPITTLIPEDSLWDDFGTLSFSKRGSIMFGGRSFGLTDTAATRAAKDQAVSVAKATDSATPNPRQRAASEAATLTPGDHDGSNEKQASASHANEDAPSVPSIRVVSIDVERESQKVRSLYESGDGLKWEDGEPPFGAVERLEPTEEVPSDEEENVASSRQSNLKAGDQTIRSPATATPLSASSSSQRGSVIRREYEPAGGLEDWDDLEGAVVDRYGFISQKVPTPRAPTPESKSLHHSPRRRNVLTKRPGTAYSSSPLGKMRPPSRKVSARSLNTHTSEFSTLSRRSTRSSIRSAVNHLPHNKDRRWMDEAGEMLALDPGLAGLGTDSGANITKITEAQKRKETERTEKWRKMAKVLKKGTDGTGSGMDFEFDTKNPKLIERTWKGIPDCWRAAAWHSFLAASAKAWGGAAETDEFLMAEFRRLQEVSSPDDVQIDLDVPRTINGHIMFRRRYRGGQRLLFRVLHAISLYFPGTGYVQGMASLAATLLCYYDEERCFVMMVRLWRYRGLEKLYEPGFEGLMAALQEFENKWLAGKDVAEKLAELVIDPTAYGTRWYLTLFNLSIPFAAQLRVWDVFMLMGECPPDPASLPGTAIAESQDSRAPKGKEKVKSKDKEKETDKKTAPRGLDVLHATSAALIHALRDVLLDADFENAMKALTSWIPVKDEELLMKVARAEWKVHQKKEGVLHLSHRFHLGE